LEKGAETVGLISAPRKRGPDDDNDKENKEDREEKNIDFESQDWGRIYTQFACHTNIQRHDIPEMSLSQINAYLINLPDELQVYVGGGLFGGIVGDGEKGDDDKGDGNVNSDNVKRAGKPPKISEIINFCNGFSGAGGNGGK
jgi:hypothetical protein